MGRNARVVMLDYPHHVTQRGNHRQDIFLCDEDYQMYLRLLRNHAKRFALRILSYCLMTNHVHLVAIPERGDSLAKGLGRTHNDYARWFHLKRGRTGHFWQNRFFSCPLEESHLTETLRYVELNPVRAGLVDTAWEWKWSSTSARLARADPGGFLQLETGREECTGEEWRSHFAGGVGRKHSFAANTRNDSNRPSAWGNRVFGSSGKANREKSSTSEARPKNKTGSG